MNLKNKVLRGQNGKDLFFLTGKIFEDGKKGIWLINSNRDQPDYSLWNIEFLDDGKLEMWPYKGDDSYELTLELLELYLETAFDE
jgi:hypothetical protein